MVDVVEGALILVPVTDVTEAALRSVGDFLVGNIVETALTCVGDLIEVVLIAEALLKPVEDVA